MADGLAVLLESRAGRREIACLSGKDETKPVTLFSTERHFGHWRQESCGVLEMLTLLCLLVKNPRARERGVGEA